MSAHGFFPLLVRTGQCASSMKASGNDFLTLLLALYNVTVFQIFFVQSTQDLSFFIYNLYHHFICPF